MSSSTLEDVYAALADGIDAAGVAKESLYLAKVVLLLADALGDADRAVMLLREGLDGLDAMPANGNADGQSLDPK